MVPPIVGEQQKQLQRPSVQQSQTQSLPLILSTKQDALILSTKQDAQIQQASLKVISKNMFFPPATHTMHQQIQWPTLSSTIEKLIEPVPHFIQQSSYDTSLPHFIVLVVAKLYWGDAREKVCDVVGDLKLDANASSFAGSSNSKVFGHFVGLAFPREMVQSHPGLWFYACRYVVEPIYVVQLNLIMYIIEVNANDQFVELLKWLVLLTSIKAGGLTIISENDWKCFCEEWGAIETKGISAKIESNNDSVNAMAGSCEVLPICQDQLANLDKVNNESGNSQIAIKTCPEICEICIGERESCELFPPDFIISKKVHVSSPN